MDSSNATFQRNRFLILILCAVWLGAAWHARREFLPYDVNNTDIGTYLFQAQTFAEGRLWRPTPEPREFFQQWQAIVRDRSFAYYPPAHALLLALPLRWGLEAWLIPWLASGLCLGLIYLWGNRLLGPAPAACGACFMALSPMFAANAPSLLSHSTALFGTLLFLAGICHRGGRGEAFSFFMAGIALGFVFANRSLNAVALALVWIPWVYCKRKHASNSSAQAWIAGAIGVSLVSLPLLLYYRVLAGRWCLDLFTDYWPRNRFGFGRGLGRGEPGHYFQTYADHDWTGMLAHGHYSFGKLAEWWTGNGWVSCSALLVALILIGIGWRRRAGKAVDSPVLPLVLWPLLHILLYSFYFTPSTAFSGPRYLTEILPSLALASGWSAACMASWRFGKGLALIGLLAWLGASVDFKNQFYLQNARGIAARRAAERCVLEGARPPALVFIRSFWLGHPFPIFLNRSSLSDPILYACDRGAEDRRLVALHPDRNAYIFSLTPPRSNEPFAAELVPIYDAAAQRWLMEPDAALAPFFIGSKFTAPMRLRGEDARRLFSPKPEEIEPQ